jgi:hypothetical protein
MHAPRPIVIFVPLPVTANGWLHGPKRQRPPQPKPQSWPLKRSIPMSATRQALADARRYLAPHGDAWDAPSGCAEGGRRGQFKAHPPPTNALTPVSGRWGAMCVWRRCPVKCTRIAIYRRKSPPKPEE